MKSSDACKLKIMSCFGYKPTRFFPDNGEGFWRVEVNAIAITAMDAGQLFENWLENDDVLEKILRIKTKRSQNG
jgi:hypothetical protein